MRACQLHQCTSATSQTLHEASYPAADGKYSWLYAARTTSLPCHAYSIHGTAYNFSKPRFFAAYVPPTIMVFSSRPLHEQFISWAVRPLLSTPTPCRKRPLVTESSSSRITQPPSDRKQPVLSAGQVKARPTNACNAFGSF